MVTGAFSQNMGNLFSELKLVTDNLSLWEATESYVVQCVFYSIIIKLLMIQTKGLEALSIWVESSSVLVRDWEI